MNNRIDQIMKGLISLAVMLMFTVAFIAGQARANLPALGTLADDTTHEADERILLDAGSLHRFQLLPQLIDIYLALPIDLDIRMVDRAVSGTPPDESGADELPAQ